MELRKLLYETRKRWDGEMDEKTLIARESLAKALVKNKNYDEAIQCLTKFEASINIKSTAGYYKRIADWLNGMEWYTRHWPGTERNEFNIRLIEAVVKDLDLSGLRKDEDEKLMELLEIKAKGLEQLKRYGEEAEVRKVIYETKKRWNGNIRNCN